MFEVVCFYLFGSTCGHKYCPYCINILDPAVIYLGQRCPDFTPPVNILDPMATVVAARCALALDASSSCLPRVVGQAHPILSAPPPHRSSAMAPVCEVERRAFLAGDGEQDEACYIFCLFL
jgi:hypothetical protein